VPAAAPAYIRHRPEDTVLYNLVEEYAAAFFAQLGEEGASLPAFVHEEFERYLRCGRLEEGFVRVVCTGCRHEHLVAFSCKCRGFCPSCGARRMVESAAGLVDHVLPHVPIRQWVLTFPWPLRLLFAARPELLTRVLAVVTRALSTALAHRAGLRASDAEAGLVTFIQRFGSALNLNVHLHMLVPDGAYTFDGERPRFHRSAPPTAPELERLLDTLIQRITRTLVRSGALVEQGYDGEEQHWLELEADGEDALTQLQGASIRYRIAVGPIAGRKTLRLHTPGAGFEGRAPVKRLTAERDGFSLNAAVACKADERRKLERLCRYVARPAIALERLGRDGDGLVVYELKHAFRDGTTHVLFEPLDFLARLAALVPRPRAHLIRFHGLLAPNARHRRLVVPALPCVPAGDDGEPTRVPTRAQMTWAQRLRRVFDIDISRCTRCGAALRVLAVITDPRVVAAILAHLEARAARAPPPERHRLSC
jgi:hypothetical protein